MRISVPNGGQLNPHVVPIDMTRHSPKRQTPGDTMSISELHYKSNSACQESYKCYELDSQSCILRQIEFLANNETDVDTLATPSV